MGTGEVRESRKIRSKGSASVMKEGEKEKERRKEERERKEEGRECRNRCGCWVCVREGGREGGYILGWAPVDGSRQKQCRENGKRERGKARSIQSLCSRFCQRKIREDLRNFAVGESALMSRPTLIRPIASLVLIIPNTTSQARPLGVASRPPSPFPD
jgi:hypothetical protein